MLKNKIFISLFLLLLFPTKNSFAEDQNVLNVLETIQKDLKTLEKAVYSESLTSTNSSEKNELNQSAEDVLTRHLLKKLKRPSYVYV